MIAIVAAEAITCIVRIIVMYKTISLKFIFSKSYKYLIIFLLTFGISLAFYLGLVGKINDIILMCITCMIYGFTLLIFTLIVRPYLYTFVLENLKKILIKRHKTIEWCSKWKKQMFKKTFLMFVLNIFCWQKDTVEI